MGNLCSKRKTSDTISEKSEGSDRKNKGDSNEGLENHSVSSKRSSYQNGTSTSQQKDSQQASTAKPSESKSAKAQGSSRGHNSRDEPSSFSVDSMASTVTAGEGTFDGSFPVHLPVEVTKQSDVAKSLLLGRFLPIKSFSKGKKITLYICTSYSQDFSLEKYHFHVEVYPTLRKYCSARGYELHVTDIHWNSNLEKNRDLELPELCLNELRRQQEVCYVIPVLFLSNSIGTLLLPKTIEQQDFETGLLQNISSTESKKVLEKWYTLDPHAQPPCYQLASVVTHLPDIESSIDAKRTEAQDQWHIISDELLSIMLKIFPTELRDSYLTTVIEQEIHNSIFMSSEVGRRSVWIQRVFTHTQQNQNLVHSSLSQPDIVESEKNRRLQFLQNELKNQLIQDHILRLLVKWIPGGLSTENSDHKEYLGELSSQLGKQLKSIVDEIMDEDESKGVRKSHFGVKGGLLGELMQHSIYCQHACKCSLPVESTINKIKEYVENENWKHPLIVHGDQGSGKSSLLARVVQQCPTWLNHSTLLYRFVALTKESGSLLHLLRTLTLQLTSLLVGRNYWIPHNVKCYAEEMLRLIQCHPNGPLVVVMLDGLDAITPFDKSDLDWLSEELPANLKIIITCSSQSKVFQAMKCVVKSESAFILMPTLNDSGAEGLLTSSMLQFCHSTDQFVFKSLKTLVQSCPTPLYIKILTWLASRDTQKTINMAKLRNTRSAIDGLFDFVEDELGKACVEACISLLCASRFGLCDSELVDLLSLSPIFCSQETSLEWAPASIFLARLCQSLGPFLGWRDLNGTKIITWKDPLVKQIAVARYLSKEHLIQKVRETISTYFEKGVTNKNTGRAVQVLHLEPHDLWHFRQRDEIPYQRFQSKGSIKETHLCSFAWLDDVVKSQGVFDIIEDIYLECGGQREELDHDLLLLLQLLELSAEALHFDGCQFISQLYGKMGSNQLTSTFIGKAILEATKNTEYLYLLPYSSSLLYNLEDMEKLKKNECEGPKFFGLSKSTSDVNHICRMKSGNEIFITVSTERGELSVWNMLHEEPLRVIKGLASPLSVKIINDTLVVILCGRELQVYDIDEGKLISKMKGVMNQKMPYYGLHNENLIVALSRNRMYINLMNVETGDCVSTFKVGEDRFLNSLIVSENGKTLVCGDETQKPFPLLVWDLTSRKLIYDLRIPHHEFLTHLSAITKEGHFVCCVCKEVDDPGANFIVVYDLQSGTLFKKWKPGVNTNAIAISAQGNCVITALEDNRLLVWDLVTGVCQWTLSKHTAPADTLRLDDKGAYCISCDSTGRDRSLCLWNINTGKLISSFTPDIQFTACELSNQGSEIILGLKGKAGVSKILLRSKIPVTQEEAKESFGKEENRGIIIDLNVS